MTGYKGSRQLLLTVLLILTVFISLSARSVYAQNGYAAYDLASVAQPAKGNTFIDPIFKTKVLRVTDDGDGKQASVAYSYWSAFNSDSKKFVIGIDGIPHLYKLKPKKLKATKVGPLFDSDQMQWEGLSWSASDPNTIYGLSGYLSSIKIRGYNVNSRKYTFEHDFTAAGELPAGIAQQMSKARSNDRYFSFHWRPAEGQPVKYAVVYDKELNKTHLFDVNDPTCGFPEFDECRLDRDGNFLVMISSKDFYVWQFAAQAPDKRIVVGKNAEQRAGGHSDSGSGVLFHSDIWGNNGNRLIRRPLNTPVNWQDMFDSGVQDWQTDHHISLTGPSDDWVLVTTMTYTTPNYIFPFTNEIFMIKSDGTGKVERLLQHRSTNKDYWSTPRANLSPDGKFIAYTSDWGGGHVDVYIAALPADIWKKSSK
jgi:hypothetical protein